MVARRSTSPPPERQLVKITLLAVLGVSFGLVTAGGAQQATFFEEPVLLPSPRDLAPAAPSFEGKVLIRDLAGRWVPVRRSVPISAAVAPGFPPAPAGDVYLQDGSE